ncbi:RAVE (Regulator of V-ATPase assembly) complex subunit RAV1/DMX protein [Forsythia ovata]|uniref:RAVE (Regulator of V-ATPase assembly) complex subunit RAV1/DMX protein n=1 Tax=Forsythia ovata TaxID=205694 RepID=A0ABD1VHH7_9LAMI
MLQLVKAWHEEHVETKLVNAKLIFEEKYYEMSNIIVDLETLLRSSNVNTDMTKKSQVELNSSFHAFKLLFITAHLVLENLAHLLKCRQVGQSTIKQLLILDCLPTGVNKWARDHDSLFLLLEADCNTLQSTKVEAIKWTGSGDGIVSGGINVVLWRKKEILREIAWKFKPKVPQVLVYAAWSSTGPSATAPWSKLQVGDSSSPINEASKCVLVFQGDEHSKCVQAELHHPLPTLHLVLLTCCIDGTVRLWSEACDGRIRRAGKDSSDQKAPRLFFGVIAVLEVNQTLNGSLGSNVFVSWATEVEGIIATGKEARYYSHVDDVQNDNTGKYDAIQSIVLEAPWFTSSKGLCAYISCSALREVDTSKVLSEILKNGDQDDHSQVSKKLYVPRVEDKNSHMQMLNISRMNDLIANSMDKLELAPVDAEGNERKDGLAFNKSGRRLGCGGGTLNWVLGINGSKLEGKLLQCRLSDKANDQLRRWFADDDALERALFNAE